MVPNTSELFPEPETPVNTVSRRFGSSTLTSFRLFTRAPWTRIRSWLSATCTTPCLPDGPEGGTTSGTALPAEVVRVVEPPGVPGHGEPVRAGAGRVHAGVLGGRL